MSKSGDVAVVITTSTELCQICLLILYTGINCDKEPQLLGYMTVL